MTKIRNRFTTGEIITVHDNLLCDLYSLNRDGGFTCVEINNNQYLVNQKKGRGYTIGLRVKIPDELLIVNGVRSKFDDLDSDIKEEIEDKLSSILYFSNIEIYVANMLFDKFKNLMVITENVKRIIVRFMLLKMFMIDILKH